MDIRSHNTLVITMAFFWLKIYKITFYIQRVHATKTRMSAVMAVPVSFPVVMPTASSAIVQPSLSERHAKKVCVST